MSKIKNTFFTSDWHIGHANSIIFDNRPFTDLKHMHRVLINNFNASVKHEDITYFAGDIGVSDAKTTSEVIHQLNGTKILVLGNHDKGPNAMYDAGFDVVLNSVSLVIANELVTISHMPLPGLWREDVEGMRGAGTGELWHGESKLKNIKYTVANRGQFHLHGHIHSSPTKDRSTKILDKQYDIGVTANNYRPVSISQIESWISTYKRDENEKK